MIVEVVSYSSEWPSQFSAVSDDLRHALRHVHVIAIEHVGSTSVPGLSAKPILDIDVVVRRRSVSGAIRALQASGYEYLGEQGIADRHALRAPEQGPRRNVYVCVEGALSLRNHLAVRDTLRRSPDLRSRYESVKRELAARSDLDLDQYVVGKSAVLQEVLALSDLTTEEKREILLANS